MKKLLLSAFLVSSFAMNAQVTIFEDSFETYDDFAITGFGNWQTLDLDMLNTYTGGLPDGAMPWTNAGAPQAWIVFNPTTAGVTNDITGASGETRNFDPHTGSKYAASWAGVPASNGQTATANNDFLISPVINLGASNNELTFYIKSLSDSYGLEEYRVYIYLGTGTPAALSDFTSLSLGLTAPYDAWQLKTIALNYSNQPIRIAIRNTGSDHYMLMVDDVKVTSSNLSVNQALAAKFSTYPNPTKGIISLTNADSIRINSINITDLNGRTVKSAVYTDGPQNLEINIADLSSGMYMMNIATDAGTTTKKIVKE